MQTKTIYCVNDFSQWELYDYYLFSSKEQAEAKVEELKSNNSRCQDESCCPIRITEKELTI